MAEPAVWRCGLPSSPPDRPMSAPLVCSGTSALKNYATVGTCPICGQGRLIVARDDSSRELYVLCEECEAEWSSPEVSQSIDAATRDIHGQSTLLECEELLGHPWSAFLR
jgi:hypothetical protein